MKLVLATLLEEWDLELLDRNVEPGRQNVTIGPKGGVRMRVLRARRPERPASAEGYAQVRGQGGG
jgi:hypothetical protein